MSEFPAAGAFEPPLTVQELIDAQEALLAAAKQLPGAAAASELTITSGVVVPTGGTHTVDTEGNAAADDLTHVQATEVRDGAILVLWPESTGRVVTVKHMAGGVGQCYLRSEDDYAMGHESAVLVLQRRGTVWYEIVRGARRRPVPGRQLFTGNGTFTVPDNATTVWVTAVGGGGGGGGGGGAGADATPGTVGSAGASSIFGASLVVALGGAGGGRGERPAFEGQGGHAGLGGNPGHNTPGTLGGRGGSGPFTVLGRYGSGGNGGAGADDSEGSGGGGGGSGGITEHPAIRVPVDVSGLSSIGVTVGQGGAGGAGGTGAHNGVNGSAGYPGAVLVEWF